MTFERFDAGQWAEEPGSTQPSGFCAPGDPRVHDVLNEIERLEQMSRPRALSEAQWYDLLRDLRHVADHWLDLALVCGWTLPELFGSPPSFKGRAGLMGAAVLLRGRSIEGIDSERIVICNRLGAPAVFRRWPGADRAGQAMIWDVVLQGGDL